MAPEKMDLMDLMDEMDSMDSARPNTTAEPRLEIQNDIHQVHRVDRTTGL